jgi:hypothetical protein
MGLCPIRKPANLSWFPARLMQATEAKDVSIGWVLNVLHDAAAVVVAAEDVAGPPDVVGQGLAGFGRVEQR